MLFSLPTSRISPSPLTAPTTYPFSAGQQVSVLATLILCACRSSAASWCYCAKTELLSLTGWGYQNLHCVSSDLDSSSASPAHNVISVETEWICQARCWCWCWMTSAYRLLCGPIAFKMFLRGKAEYSASYIQQDTTYWLASNPKVCRISVYQDIHITAALSPIIVKASPF